VSVVGGDVEGLNIVTSAAGMVTGRVVVEGDASLPSPLSKMTVRSLAVDRVEDLRTVRTARVDQSGVFTIKGVRPGSYYCIAAVGVSNNQWNDPEYLDSLRQDAQRVTLKEGEDQRLDLVVKPAGGQ
jgi:hypothetical protein